MEKQTTGLSLPYHTDGGRHPSGSILTYRLYRQPDGDTRIDCFSDGFMVNTLWSITEERARMHATSFMRSGHQYDPDVMLWTTKDDEKMA